mmetsp:Transcript_16913/g.52876  ORF Transcript_16913/g.52876 Transcript_16913/m.52876 type:complete len:568 (-) Transcript_16913:72-1775(-)
MYHHGLFIFSFLLCVPVAVCIEDCSMLSSPSSCLSSSPCGWCSQDCHVFGGSSTPRCLGCVVAMTQLQCMGLLSGCNWCPDAPEGAQCIGQSQCLMPLGPTLPPLSPFTDPPTDAPTNIPTVQPSLHPTSTPTTANPTPNPTSTPTTTNPTSNPTPNPTVAPTTQPTPNPTVKPTPLPTPTMTSSPIALPTLSPTVTPTQPPTRNPTGPPTPKPTPNPSPPPTHTPTGEPTPFPSASPTSSGGGTPFPTKGPSPKPSSHPTRFPTSPTTPKPTAKVTPAPSATPQPTVDWRSSTPSPPTTSSSMITTSTVPLPYTGTTANTTGFDPASQGGNKVDEGKGDNGWVAVVVVPLVIVCCLLAMAGAAVAHRRRRRAVGQTTNAIPMATVAIGKDGPASPAFSDAPTRSGTRSRQRSRAISRSSSRPGALRGRSGSYGNLPVIRAGAYENVADATNQYEKTTPMYARPSAPPHYADVAMLRSRQTQAQSQYAGDKTVQTRLGLGTTQPVGRSTAPHAPVRPPTTGQSTQQYVSIPASGYVPFPDGKQEMRSPRSHNTHYVNMPPRKPPPRK